MTQKPTPDDIEGANADGAYVPPRDKPADDAGYLEVMAWPDGRLLLSVVCG